MHIRRLLGLAESKAQEVPASTVIREGEPAEYISVCHRDGSISEVEVSANNDNLNIRVNPALDHPPRLSGGYL